MCQWVEGNKWKAIKEGFALFKDIVLLIAAIIVLFYGNNILERYDRDEENRRLELNFLNTKIDDTISNPDKAPKTEQGIDGTNTINALNLSLADYPDQVPVVEGWLKNPYSGYPALVTAIKRVIGNNRVVGNSVPLTIINANNLQAHGRGTGTPIIDANKIEDNKLKEAIYSSWREKNSGASSELSSFEKIVEPRQ